MIILEEQQAAIFSSNRQGHSRPFYKVSKSDYLSQSRGAVPRGEEIENPERTRRFGRLYVVTGVAPRKASWGR